MGKPSLLSILKIGTGVGKILAPGVVGSVLDEVNKSIADRSDPSNAGASLANAKINDDQNQAIIVLHQRQEQIIAQQNEILERLRTIENSSTR